MGGCYQTVPVVVAVEVHPQDLEQVSRLLEIVQVEVGSTEEEVGTQLTTVSLEDEMNSLAFLVSESGCDMAVLNDREQEMQAYSDLHRIAGMMYLVVAGLASELGLGPSQRRKQYRRRVVQP